MNHLRWEECREPTCQLNPTLLCIDCKSRWITGQQWSFAFIFFKLTWSSQCLLFLSIKKQTKTPHISAVIKSTFQYSLNFILLWFYLFFFNLFHLFIFLILQGKSPECSSGKLYKWATKASWTTPESSEHKHAQLSCSAQTQSIRAILPTCPGSGVTWPCRIKFSGTGQDYCNLKLASEIHT